MVCSPGVIKRNWMTKHLLEVPSVVVVFVSLDCASPDTTGVARTVAGVGRALGGRATKLAIVILQSADSTLRDEDSVLTTLCTECSVSSRAVFTLS